MSEQTLFIVKPDGVQRKLIGEIISRFEKKGFTILIYENTTKKLKVPETIHADWNKGTSRLPPATRDIGHNCFFNVVVQALAFCDLQSEVSCFLEQTYCNEPSANKTKHNIIACKNGNRLLSNFPTRFHKDFFLPREHPFDKALRRFNNFDDIDTGELSRSLFDHPCQLYHDCDVYQTHFDLESRLLDYNTSFNVYTKITLEFPYLLVMEGKVGYFVRYNYNDKDVDISLHNNAVAHVEDKTKYKLQDSIHNDLSSFAEQLFFCYTLCNSMLHHRFPYTYLQNDDISRKKQKQVKRQLYCPW